MPSTPNVLLVTTDQHRGDCLGVAGHPAVRTPNLDAWLDEGAFFPRAYSECPSCIAARRTIITGTRPYTHGMPGYRDEVPFHPADTLMRSLATAGYHTFGAGKMHFTPQRALHGFHQTVLYEGAQRFGDYVDDYETWLRARTNVDEGASGVDHNSWHARPWHLPEPLHVTNWTVDAAIDLLVRRDPTRPFFLWVSFQRPHAPLDPPQVYWDMYADADLPDPPRGDWAMRHAIPPPLDPNAWQGYLPPHYQRRAQIGYYALISHIDQQIGRLLIAMRRLRVFGDTLMLLMSDHGEMLGDHNLWRKTYAYEGSARIPFLVRFPRGSGWPTGRVREHVVGLQDVMPTILDAVGVPIPETVEGRSLVPALRDEPEEWRPYIHGEHAACYAPENAMHYLTDGRTKYVWFPETGEEQLFDLVADPGERRDLARDPAHAARVAEWRGKLIQELVGRTDGFSDGRRLVPKPFRMENYL